MAQSVNDLLDQVRAQLDETNTENATDSQLLQALNRGQRAATNIIARKYESLFWESTNTTTVAGQREYDIPADAHGRRVEMVEISVNGINYELQRINNHKRSAYTTTSQVQRPFYYTLKRNKIELYPLPSVGNTLVIHYTKRPEDMVLQQGRITSVDSGSNFVLVDTLGSALSTSTTGFVSYVNVIDYQTGEIKGTCQVSAINTTLKQVTFKSSGLSRSTVLGRTVSTSLPSDIAVDDYLCLVTGTAVPELDDAYIDYVIQFAVIEIRRRFGEAIESELAALSTLEKEIERMWAGRETSNRVRKTNSHFSRGSVRRLIT